MKILIVNQAFWPDVVATAQHMTDWAEDLTARGHEVTVIASRSLYGQSRATLARREQRGNIRIIRVGGNLFRKGRILTRLIDFGMFHLAALWKVLTLPRHDAVVCLTTPPFIGVVGRAAQMLRGWKYIQYEMDLYPDIAVALGVMKPNAAGTRFFDGMHRHLLRKADRVVVLGRCMRRLITAKGIHDDKQVLVTPWADETELAPVPREHNAFRKAHGLEGKCVVMYSGNLGLGHDVTTICQAMERLQKAGDDTVRFVFIGGGRRMKEVTAFVQDRGLTPPLMLDYQPREKLAETLSAADIHLITQAEGTSGIIVPSKLYGILAAGRPAIYIGPKDSEVALTLAEHDLGDLLDVGDAEGMVAAIRRRQAGLAGQEAFAGKARAVLREGHSRAVCCAKLSAMVENLRGGR